MRYDPELAAKITSLRADGLSLNKIAKQLKTSCARVCFHVMTPERREQFNLDRKIRVASEVKGEDRRCLSDKQLKQIIALRLKGLPVYKIAKQVKSSVFTVRKYLRLHKVPIPKQRQSGIKSKKDMRNYSEQMEKHVHALKEQGVNNKSIASRLGIPARRVAWYLMTDAEYLKDIQRMRAYEQKYQKRDSDERLKPGEWGKPNPQGAQEIRELLEQEKCDVAAYLARELRPAYIVRQDTDVSKTKTDLRSE